MAFAPIAFIIPQYENYANWYLKAYEQGSLTPKVMATDIVGLTTLAKSKIDTQGFPTTDGKARFIPFIDGAFDMWIFPTEVEANKNITANAIQFSDNIEPGSNYLTDDGTVQLKTHFLPNLDNLYNIGSATFRWLNGYFGGDVNIDGTFNSTGESTIDGRNIGNDGDQLDLNTAAIAAIQTSHYGRVSFGSGSGTVAGGSGFAYSWSTATCTITHNIGSPLYTVIATENTGAGYVMSNVVSSSNTCQIRATLHDGTQIAGVAFNFAIIVD